jgi:hypothetical protein
VAVVVPVGRFRAARMSAFENLELLKSTEPQTLELSFRAAPKSRRRIRRLVPGCATAKSQARR